MKQNTSPAEAGLPNAFLPARCRGVLPGGQGLSFDLDGKVLRLMLPLADAQWLRDALVDCLGSARPPEGRPFPERVGDV